MQKSLLVFDFDGTLANTLEIAVDIVNDLSGEYRYAPIRREDMPDLRRKHISELMRMSGMNWLQLPGYVRKARNRFKARIREVQPVSGMREALEGLKAQGYRLGILTSNTQENVTAFLALHDMQWFDFVYAPDSIFGKARRLRRILREYKLPQEALVMIGDEVRDLEAANKSGVDGIGVTWGFNTRELLQAHKPLAIVDQPEELLKMFR